MIYERASVCVCVFIWGYRESVKGKQDKNYPSEITEKEQKTKKTKKKTKESKTSGKRKWSKEK